MIFRLGFRDPILQQFSLRLQRNPFAREDKKPITLECKKLGNLGISTSSAANLDGILKPLFLPPVFGPFGGQETPKSTPFVQKHHHFASKDRKHQWDAATVIREVSFELYSHQPPIRAPLLNFGPHDIKSERCYRNLAHFTYKKKA